MRWFVRRLATSITVLFAALVINFAIPRMMPGSPIYAIAGGIKLTPEARQALIERFGLDASIQEQFWRYFAGIFQGDLGVSFYHYPRAVTDVVMDALPWTLLIIGSALILQVITGYFAGVTAGWKPGSKTDSGLQTTALVLLSAPIFWLGMIFLFVFSFQLGWFPLAGAQTPAATYSSTFEYVADIIRHAALPILAFAISRYAMYQLILRNTMVTTLREQYILTAEAKGLSENRIKYRHAARNSLLPMITMFGVSFIMVVGASVYIETVFSYPGLGLLLYNGVLNRDYPLVQGCFLGFAVLIVAANFVVDILYVYLDPRIRY